MTFAATLSPADIGAYRNQTSGFDLKVKNAYNEITMQLRLLGSLWNDDAYLACLSGCSKRYFQNRVWPALKDLFFIGDDGRVQHPEIERAPRDRPRLVRPELSEVRREAVNSRRDRQPAATNEPTNGLQNSTNGLQNSTNGLQNSTKFVGESMAFVDGRAPAPTLSISESEASELRESLSFPLESDSLRERVAPVGEGAPGSTNGPTNGPTKPAAQHLVKKRIPPDWRPSGELMASALLIRADAEAQIEKFILWNTGQGATAADWGALFPRFLEQANAYEARRNPQLSASIVIHGGKPEEANTPPEPADEPIVGVTLEAQWARVQRALGKGVTKNWLSKADLVGLNADGELTIAWPTPFTRDHVNKNYGARLTTLWRAENPEIKRVDLIVADSARRTASG